MSMAGTFLSAHATLQYRVFKAAMEMLTWCPLLAGFEQALAVTLLHLPETSHRQPFKVTHWETLYS